MSSSQVARAISVLQALFDYPEGRSLGEIAEHVQQPKAGVFRDLREWCAVGWVRQDDAQRYLLTYQMIGASLRHLGRMGVHDSAQPVLERVARSVRELTRLAVVDGDALYYVAWAQGRTTPLRYEPINGDVAPLFCTATGQAYLSTLDAEQAETMLAKEWDSKFSGFGSKAPKTIAEALERVAAAKKRGFGLAIDSFSEGMTAVAAAITPNADAPAVAVLSIAVPTPLCNEERAHELGQAARAAAAEMVDVLAVSRYFGGSAVSAGRAVRR